MTVAGKVVVITGGTRGIGRAVAEKCAIQGARLVICGRDEASVVQAARELTSLSPEPVLGVTADVSDFSAVEKTRDAALERHGHIDAWFNNAGVSLGYRPLDEESADELAEIVGINLTGLIFGCRAVLPYFREHGGYLLNMLGRGYKGGATPHTAVYAATKTAIASLTRSLAAENHRIPRLSINAIVPGMVETDFYRQLVISSRLERSRENWRYALEAFGVPLERVGFETAKLLGDEPGRETGRIYSLLTRRQMASGLAKMAYYGATGRMRRE